MRMSLKIFFLKETLSCPPLKITSISVAWTTTQIWTSLLLQNQPQTFSCDYWPLYFFWTWLPLGTMIKLQWFVMIKLQRHLLSSNVSPSWLFLGHLCGCCMCCRHVYSWLSVAPFASPWKHLSTSAASASFSSRSLATESQVLPLSLQDAPPTCLVISGARTPNVISSHVHCFLV